MVCLDIYETEQVAEGTAIKVHVHRVGTDYSELVAALGEAALPVELGGSRAGCEPFHFKQKSDLADDGGAAAPTDGGDKDNDSTGTNDNDNDGGGGGEMLVPW